MATYSKDQLTALFQSPYNAANWQTILKEFFNAKELRAQPERITDDDAAEEGYYLGALDTDDSYRIGLFQYRIHKGSVANKRVGLRHLVHSFVNANYGAFDAALVVFDSGDHWRLSFICDIKGEATAPKRYTFVLGDKQSCYNTPVARFMGLQQKGISFANIKEAFSVEALTRQFYHDLFDWYSWAVSEEAHITFPSDTTTEDDDRDDIETKIIRMITRVMFVWFIKQKGLVPNRIFDTAFLSTILSDFDPMSTTVGNYYNAILQNLFFATLNRAIEDEQGNRRRFATNQKRDIKTLYRYAELFSISEQEVIDMFAEVPFLNGGLFECLDKTRTIDGVERAYNYDGFSRNSRTFADGRYRYRAVVPNVLFFEPERGLLSILSRYNFTIEENSPSEQQVALDPELLGKVFENLLGAYNPETKETARNQSGSFYTPREIVNYMVDESLMAFLGNTPTVQALFDDSFSYDERKATEYAAIAEKLRNVKILDPACGSGAFPMGLLNRIVEILKRISPTEKMHDLKLAIIERCIYGADIQSIAAQITKLRFFISLICDCEKDDTKPNYGIPTLPNLETKFVAANSLLAKKKRENQGNLFTNPDIEPTKQALIATRHEHFSAKTANRKTELRKKDEELRAKLARLLAENDDFAPKDAKQLAAWNPYDQNTVADFFDPGWMFGVEDGFDIVIGNPPYIQLQNNGGELAKLYEPCEFQSFARTGDIYCLFYERGHQLLKQGGHLCFITSNKWMRAGYGEKTRQFFATRTNPKLLIDFAGVKIFESATVDTNILLFSKSDNLHHTVCAVTNKQNADSVKNLSIFVRQQHTICDFPSSDSWVILSPIEQSIKRKIEAVGTPLKDWDIQINYGIKTGCNEAFIITTEKRNEILANCRTDKEREKTAELIRPILRGRDIKRYGYEWANLWIINTHNGIKGKLPRIKIDDYPAVKEWLDKGGTAYNGKLYKGYAQIKKRADQGDTPYNLRNCAYLEDFSNTKLFYADITQELNFVLCEEQMFCNNTTYFIVAKDRASIKHLQYFLNSKLIDWYYRSLSVQLGEKAVRMFSIYVLNIPIPRTKNKDVYASYGLTDEETAYIMGQ